MGVSIGTKKVFRKQLLGRGKTVGQHQNNRLRMSLAERKALRYLDSCVVGLGKRELNPYRCEMVQVAILRVS